MQEIIKLIQSKEIGVVVYELVLKEDKFFGKGVMRKLKVFKVKADVTFSNHMVSELEDVRSKVYTRRLSGID